MRHLAAFHPVDATGGGLDLSDDTMNLGEQALRNRDAAHLECGHSARGRDLRVNPGCPLTLRLIAASGFCKAEAAPRHCVGFPGVVADGAANPLLSALDPLFRGLRRFWAKPLKLQA